LSGVEGRLYCSKFINGTYSEPEILERLKDIDAYSPCIAADESDLIISSSEKSGVDLRILFKKKDGTWAKEKNLSEIIGLNGMCPIVSPDGKYLIFIALLDGIMTQFWVDASFIKELREQNI
jgi:hypothetical protein